MNSRGIDALRGAMDQEIERRNPCVREKRRQQLRCATLGKGTAECRACLLERQVVTRGAQSNDARRRAALDGFDEHADATGGVGRFGFDGRAHGSCERGILGLAVERGEMRLDRRPVEIHGRAGGVRRKR
jgi:hypothetical protein